MDHDNYYEQDDGHDVIVHLDYNDPEPSLFQQSRGHDRPMISREYAPVVRTSKRRLSRPNNTNARGFNRLTDDMEEHHDDRDDDDSMYRGMTSRVNIQDQRQNGNFGRMRSNSRERIGRTRETAGAGRSDNNMGSGRSVVSRPSLTGAGRSDNNMGSGRSVVSRLSLTSRQTKTKPKMDLTRPDADSSFELFATLLIQHLDPKIKGYTYVLEKGDIAYFEAIMPETLRLPFVEAVRVRTGRLPKEAVEGESDLDSITRKCAAVGLGQRVENNFLLGGGEERDGKRIIRIVDENIENERLASPSGMTEADVLAQIEAAYQNRPNKIATQPLDIVQPENYDGIVNTNGGIKVAAMNSSEQGVWKEEDLTTEREAVFQHEDNQLSSEIERVRLSSEAQGEMVVQKETLNPSVPNIAQRGPNSSLLEDCEVLNKETLFNEVIEEDLSIQEAVFDLTVKKEFDRKTKAKEKRKTSPSRRMTNFTAAISVNTSPSNLDMTIAAFEPEWRDGLWDIFNHGICHPLPCLSFCAPIFALGQVMTRLNLNWVGVPSNEAGTKAIFEKLGTVVTVWATINIVGVSSCVCVFEYIRPWMEMFVFVMVTTNLWFYAFCVFAIGNARQYLREIYNIHDGEGSDHLLAALYMPFTIAQMGRHTADYNALQGRICTATGLAQDADYSFVSNINSMNSFGSYKSFNDDDDGTSFGGSAVYTRKSYRSAASKSRRSRRSHRSSSRMSSIRYDDETSFSGSSYTGSAASLV